MGERRTPAEVTHDVGAFVAYLGRTEDVDREGWVCFNDAAPLRALTDALHNATQVRVEDPLSFPWEVIGPIDAPLTIDLSSCDLLDLAALDTVFDALTPGDSIECDDPAVQRFVEARFRPAGTTLDERRLAKQRARSQHHIIETIRRDADARGDTITCVEADRAALEMERDDALRGATSPPTTWIIQFAGEMITGTTDGFVQLVTRTVGERPVTVVGVWGQRPAPGAPLDGAIVAVRLGEASK